MSCNLDIHNCTDDIKLFSLSLTAQEVAIASSSLEVVEWREGWEAEQ